MSNFDFIATYVDLSDSPTYTTNVTLEGQLLKISFVWNERIGKRTIFIRNSADICYLQNTILHPNESFELNSNAVFDDLPYKVVLQKVGDTNKVGNIYNWSKDFILCFYRTVDIETEKLNVKYGVTTQSTPVLPKPNDLVVDLVVDPANPDPTIKKFYKYGTTLYKTSTAACEAWLATTSPASWGGQMPTVKGNDYGVCQLYGGGYNYNGNVGANVQEVENTAYDPAAENPKNLPL